MSVRKLKHIKRKPLDAMESMSRITRRWLDQDRPPGANLQLAPKTRFNRSIDKPRTYAVADFPNMIW